MTTYIVAEIGLNHQGDTGLATELIDAAHEAGADAVKFQYVVASGICTPDSEYYATFRRGELDHEDYEMLYAHANALGLDAFATVVSVPLLDDVLDLNPPQLKVSSSNLTNLPLIDAINETGWPVFLSTGGCTLDEIRTSVKRLRNCDVTLLHCVMAYPAQNANLRAITTLQRAFPNFRIGYSDHTLGNLACMIAVGLGATVIEKHFTLDKTMEGPDHHFACEPDELRQLVADIRETERLLGDGKKWPLAEEQELLRVARRYVVASKRITVGERLTGANLGCKRTGHGGIEPRDMHALYGRQAPRNYAPDEAILWEHFEKG